jgi:hypothetical protein
VISFEMRIADETGQQAPAFAPLAWVADAGGTVTLAMTGGMHGDTWGLWQDGSCTNDDQVQLSAGGSTAIYGFIGPATPAQLASAYVYVSWATGNNVPGTPPQLSQPLMQLLPAPAVTWLKAHGGQAPQAAPGPVSSPTSCPSAPAGYDAPQKIAFSTACAGWLGDVDEQLQWDHGDPHSAEVSECERSDDTQVEGATMQRTDLTDAQRAAMKAHLLSACLAGVKAAGAP